MKKLKPVIIHIPFFILLIDGISFLLSVIDFYFYDYWWIGEVTGHNILTVIYMLFYAYYNRLCSYTVICIISLGLLNVLNITFYFIPLDYYQLYAGIIIFTGLIFAIIHHVRTKQ